MKNFIFILVIALSFLFATTLVFSADDANYTTEADSPALDAYTVVPHDTNEVTVTRGIYVGGAGDIKLTTKNNKTVTFVAVPVGVILPVRAKIIFSTDTTATYMIGLY